MIVWYHNPSDKTSVEALQALFVQGERFPVINSESGAARIVLASEDMADEFAEMDDPASVTPDAVAWLRGQDVNNVRHGNPVDFADKHAPKGVKPGRGKGSGRGRWGG